MALAKKCCEMKYNNILFLGAKIAELFTHMYILVKTNLHIIDIFVAPEVHKHIFTEKVSNVVRIRKSYISLKGSMYTACRL